MKFEKGLAGPQRKRNNLSISRQSKNINFQQGPLSKDVHATLAHYCDTCPAKQYRPFRYRSSQYYDCLEKGHTITTNRPGPKTAGRSMN